MFSLSLLLSLSLSLSLFVHAEPLKTWSWTPSHPHWVRLPPSLSSPLSPSQTLSVSIAMETTCSYLGDMLMERADPKSEKYGQHMSLEQLREVVAASPVAVKAVTSYLQSNGAVDITLHPLGDIISAKMSVADVERAFHTSLSQFSYSLSPSSSPLVTLRAQSSYSLPVSVGQYVSTVFGLIGFPPVRMSTFEVEEAVEVRKNDRVSYDTVTPDYLYKVYSVNESTANVKGNSQAVVEFANNYYSSSDLQEFFKSYDPVMVGQDVVETYNIGPIDPRTSTEANLDVQYIMAMGNFVDTFIYTQNVTNDIVDAFLSYATYVNSQSNPALVHSISFGAYGGQYDNSTVQQLNCEFMKMGMRGVSILLASGDNGVGCNRVCTSFEFDFPSSPFITMVGATQFQNQVETGATLSSGGFSLDYFRPSYQDAAVLGYFNSGVSLPSSSYYYSDGRAYPDVSAAGVNVEIVQKGRKEAVSGTSCSAPIFAGLIALVNGERMKQGKSSLGFLNPFLYSNPGMFTDITVGNNAKCPAGSGCCCPGFDAYKGWDPVTGLGSPVYPKILKAALALP